MPRMRKFFRYKKKENSASCGGKSKGSKSMGESKGKSKENYQYGILDLVVFPKIFLPNFSGAKKIHG